MKLYLFLLLFLAGATAQWLSRPGSRLRNHRRPPPRPRGPSPFLPHLSPFIPPAPLNSQNVTTTAATATAAAAQDVSSTTEAPVALNPTANNGAPDFSATYNDRMVELLKKLGEMSDNKNEESNSNNDNTQGNKDNQPEINWYSSPNSPGESNPSSNSPVENNPVPKSPAENNPSSKSPAESSWTENNTDEAADMNPMPFDHSLHNVPNGYRPPGMPYGRRNDPPRHRPPQPPMWKSIFSRRRPMPPPPPHLRPPIPDNSGKSILTPPRPPEPKSDDQAQPVNHGKSVNYPNLGNQGKSVNHANPGNQAKPVNHANPGNQAQPENPPPISQTKEENSIRRFDENIEEAEAPVRTHIMPEINISPGRSLLETLDEEIKPEPKIEDRSFNTQPNANTFTPQSNANTLSVLAKLSPKKPIVLFMRQEGIMETHWAGADPGKVVKKYAGSTKIQFFNGTVPEDNVPPVFLAPEDTTPPRGYGKMPIPKIEKRTYDVTTPKPTYLPIEEQIKLLREHRERWKLQQARRHQDSVISDSSLSSNYNVNSLQSESSFKILNLPGGKHSPEFYSKVRNSLPQGAVVESIEPFNPFNGGAPPKASLTAPGIKESTNAYRKPIDEKDVKTQHTDLPGLGKPSGSGGLEIELPPNSGDGLVSNNELQKIVGALIGGGAQVEPNDLPGLAPQGPHGPPNGNQFLGGPNNFHGPNNFPNNGPNRYPGPNFPPNKFPNNGPNNFPTKGPHTKDNMFGEEKPEEDDGRFKFNLNFLFKNKKRPKPNSKKPQGPKAGQSNEKFGPNNNQPGLLGPNSQVLLPGAHGQQNQQYGPPGQQFGSPNQFGPGQQYGQPGQQFGPQGQQYGAPGQQYGPPGPQFVPPSQQYGAPGQQYGPPGQQYGSPGQQYGPPAQQYGPPGQQYGPPGPQFVPPGQQYGAPGQQYGPPNQQFGPPGQQFNPPLNNYNGPQGPNGHYENNGQHSSSSQQVQNIVPHPHSQNSNQGKSQRNNYRPNDNKYNSNDPRNSREEDFSMSVYSYDSDHADPVDTSSKKKRPVVFGDRKHPKSHQNRNPSKYYNRPQSSDENISANPTPWQKGDPSKYYKRPEESDENTSADSTPWQKNNPQKGTTIIINSNKKEGHTKSKPTVIIHGDNGDMPDVGKIIESLGMADESNEKRKYKQSGLSLPPIIHVTPTPKIMVAQVQQPNQPIEFSFDQVAQLIQAQQQQQQPQILIKPAQPQIIIQQQQPQQQSYVIQSNGQQQQQQQSFVIQTSGQQPQQQSYVIQSPGQQPQQQQYVIQAQGQQPQQVVLQQAPSQGSAQQFVFQQPQQQQQQQFVVQQQQAPQQIIMQGEAPQQQILYAESSAPAGAPPSALSPIVVPNNSRDLPPVIFVPHPPTAASPSNQHQLIFASPSPSSPPESPFAHALSNHGRIPVEPPAPPPPPRLSAVDLEIQKQHEEAVSKARAEHSKPSGSFKAPEMISLVGHHLGHLPNSVHHGGHGAAEASHYQGLHANQEYEIRQIEMPQHEHSQLSYHHAASHGQQFINPTAAPPQVTPSPMFVMTTSGQLVQVQSTPSPLHGQQHGAGPVHPSLAPHFAAPESHHPTATPNPFHFQHPTATPNSLIFQHSTAAPNSIFQHSTAAPNSIFQHSTAASNSIFQHSTAAPNSIFQHTTASPNSIFYQHPTATPSPQHHLRHPTVGPDGQFQQPMHYVSTVNPNVANFPTATPNPLQFYHTTPAQPSHHAEAQPPQADPNNQILMERADDGSTIQTSVQSFSKMMPVGHGQEDRVLEKVRTEEKIIWRELPGATGEEAARLVPIKITTQEKRFMHPDGRAEVESTVLNTEIAEELVGHQPMDQATFMKRGGIINSDDASSIDDSPRGHYNVKANNDQFHSQSNLFHSSQASSSNVGPSAFTDLLKTKAEMEKMEHELHPRRVVPGEAPEFKSVFG